MAENATATSFGNAAYRSSMQFFGDKHFAVVNVALMITRSLVPTLEGYRQHNEELHKLIHCSHGQLGTDLSPDPDDVDNQILFLNARICTPYCRAFMALVRSPLFNYMLSHRITPVFLFRGMILQSPRFGQYILSTQDNGKYGHSLIAIVGGIQGCDANERFKSLDHYPRPLHIAYRCDGQGNDIPRLTDEPEDVLEDTTDDEIGTVSTLHTPNNRIRRTGHVQGVNARLFGPAASASSGSARAAPYSASSASGSSARTGAYTSVSASSSWRPSQSSTVATYASPSSNGGVALSFSASSSSSSSPSAGTHGTPAATPVAPAVAAVAVPVAAPAAIFEDDLEGIDLDTMMDNIESNYEAFVAAEMRQ